MAGFAGETITEGLDGLRERLHDYRQMGARFTKWRGVFLVSDELPSEACMEENAHALARYAALAQEQELVPIVEPEVLMTGSHSIERTGEVTSAVLEHVFRALRLNGVMLEGMLLKPNMVVPGKDAPEQASVSEVAAATLRVLLRQVPAAVPGIVFLSGGQDARAATAHLNAMNAYRDRLPWRVTFSYARALQDPALAAWLGDAANVEAGQAMLHERARCNSAASLGQYDESMERAAPMEIPLH